MIINKATVFIRGALVHIFDSTEHLTDFRVALLRVQELIDVLPLSRQDSLAAHRVISTSFALFDLLVMGKSCFVTNYLCYVGVRRLHLLCNYRCRFGRSESMFQVLHIDHLVSTHASGVLFEPSAETNDSMPR